MPKNIHCHTSAYPIYFVSLFPAAGGTTAWRRRACLAVARQSAVRAARKKKTRSLRSLRSRRRRLLRQKPQKGKSQDAGTNGSKRCRRRKKRGRILSRTKRVLCEPALLVEERFAIAALLARLGRLNVLSATESYRTIARRGINTGIRGTVAPIAYTTEAMGPWSSASSLQTMRSRRSGKSGLLARLCD